MKLKTIEVDGKTYAEVQDGKPVYVHEDGKEIPFDAPHTVGTIKRLNSEAKTHREAKEAAEAKLQGFDGLDPDAARKAFETLKNIEDGKLVDAGLADKVKQEARETYERQLKEYEKKYLPIVEERDALKGQLRHERLSTAFGRSKFIAEKLAIPVDLVQSKFGAHFDVGEDGKIRAKDANGNPVFSRVRGGEIAEDFDEALEALVDAYPYRDHILKGTGASGSGAGEYRNGADGKRTVTRAEFDRKSETERLAIAAEAAKGSVVLID